MVRIALKYGADGAGLEWAKTTRREKEKLRARQRMLKVMDGSRLFRVRLRRGQTYMRATRCVFGVAGIKNPIATSNERRAVVEIGYWLSFTRVPRWV